MKQQLSLAAGTEAFQHRDPIYHLTESFRRTFDLLGQMRARGEQPEPGSMLEQWLMRDEVPGLQEGPGVPSLGTEGNAASGNHATRNGGRNSGSEGGRSGGNAGAQTGQTGQTAEDRLRSQMDTSSFYKARDPSRHLMDRFAQVAFQRGSLSAAVLRGQGKMMLFSCLKRTAGQDRSTQARERMLFQRTSSHRHIRGRMGDISIVNKGFADSAVGLVVDVLKDARQSLESFTAIAEGKAGQDGMGTLRKQYPFLTDSTEQEMMEQYRARLAELKGPDFQQERDVLSRAMMKTEAIIQKKTQMREDFLQRLRWISQRAAAAETELSQDSVLQQAEAILEPGEDEATTPPPPEGDGTSGNQGLFDLLDAAAGFLVGAAAVATSATGSGTTAAAIATSAASTAPATPAATDVSPVSPANPTTDPGGQTSDPGSAPLP